MLNAESVKGAGEDDITDGCTSEASAMFGLYPLPHPDGLTTEEAIQLLCSQAQSHDVVVLPSIPRGTKNNVYCLVDNSENWTRQSNGHRSVYDDGHSWRSSKSSCVVLPYISNGHNGLKRVYWIAAQQAYCSEVKVDGKRLYCPLEPQPSPDSIVKIKRYYTTLAGNTEYKRRITTLIQPSVTAEHAVAIVEYFGGLVEGTLHSQCEKGMAVATPDAENAVESEEQLEDNDCGMATFPTAGGLHSLPHRDGLTTEEALEILRAPPSDSVLSYVPKGTKNNVYCLIDNSENIERRNLGQSSVFVDDGETWESSKSTCVTSPYIVDGQRGMKRIFWIASQQAYCNEVKLDGRRVYSPLEPQPAVDAVIKIKRNYSTSVKNSKYRRRITMLIEPSAATEHAVAIVEYFGERDVSSRNDCGEHVSDSMAGNESVSPCDAGPCALAHAPSTQSNSNQYHACNNSHLSESQTFRQRNVGDRRQEILSESMLSTKRFMSCSPPPYSGTVSHCSFDRSQQVSSSQKHGSRRMKLGVAAKQRYIVSSVNQSLLQLAAKLQEAELRVSGRTSQAPVPSCSVLLGVSSTVHRHRFQFVARRQHELKDIPALDFTISDVRSLARNAEVLPMNRFLTDLAVNGPELFEESNAMMNTVVADIAVSSQRSTHTLSVFNKTGPSLWPFLSSIKATADVEHAKFLERNQHFYAGYEKSRIAEDYTEPLTMNDFEVIISHAVDTILHTTDSPILQPNVQQQQHIHIQPTVHKPASTNEARVTVPVPIAPKPEPTVNIPLPTYQVEDGSSTAARSGVSKRYAAAIANPRRFKCELCPYSTNNRSHVRRHHISVHSDARPYRCFVCNKEFARCENAKVHMISRHPEVPFSIHRLRNDDFFKSSGSRLLKPTDNDSASCAVEPVPSSTTVPDQNTYSPDGGSSELCPQMDTAASNREALKASRESSPAIPPWLDILPKIEPKFEPKQPDLQHANTASNLLEGMAKRMYYAQGNNSSSALPVSVIKQEPGFIGETIGASHLSAVADRQLCPYCNCVCQNASELANHLNTVHGLFSNAPHIPLASNPGYVVLQTAAPIFLFPCGTDQVLPNRSPVGQGCHPILPKVPASVEKCQHSPNGVSAERYFTPPSIMQRPASNVPNVQASSAASFSPASGILVTTPDRTPLNQSSATRPASSEAVRRERKRKFKTFYCTRCPDRAPFRYEKSFNKHLRQHQYEDLAQQPQ